MAIDYTGKTTTGLIGQKPFVPDAADTSNIVSEMATQQTQGAGLVKKPESPTISKTVPQIDMQSLQDDDKRILNIHLTPSLKNVFSKIFGEDLFPGMGISEPTISVARKLIENRFGSVDKFMSMVQPMKEDEIVPLDNTSGILSKQV